MPIWKMLPLRPMCIVQSCHEWKINTFKLTIFLPTITTTKALGKIYVRCASFCIVYSFDLTWKCIQLLTRVKSVNDTVRTVLSKHISYRSLDRKRYAAFTQYTPRKINTANGCWFNALNIYTLCSINSATFSCVGRATESFSSHRKLIATHCSTSALHCMWLMCHLCI